jgi:hypothetical protein
MSISVVKVGLHKEPAIYNGHFDDISKAKDSVHQFWVHHDDAVMFHYENKTRKCIWKYPNLLHYNHCELPTCFGHILRLSSRRCYFEGYIKKTTKPCKNTKH